jgi:hypothetical protein
MKATATANARTEITRLRIAASMSVEKKIAVKQTCGYAA